MKKGDALSLPKGWEIKKYQTLNEPSMVNPQLNG